jgi:hypothetical protein
LRIAGSGVKIGHAIRKTLQGGRKVTDPTDAQSAILAIQAFDPTTLEREVELGVTGKFTEIANVSAKTISLYRLVDPSVATLLSKNHTASLYQDAKNVLGFFKDVLQFAPDSSDAQSNRNKLNDQARKLHETAHAHLPPYMAESARLEQQQLNQRHETFLAEQQQEIAATRDALQSTIRKLEDQITKSDDHVTEIETRVESALQAARDAAAQQGVQFQAKAFQIAFADHSDAADKWLRALFAFACVLVIWACAAPWTFAFITQASQLVIPSEQLIAAKILGFAVLSFIVVICARSYFAHRHNAVVNLHRQNALITYKALVEASSDSINREIILQHAAACIFGPQSTGYSREGKGGPPSVHNVIETLGNRVAGGDHP